MELLTLDTSHEEPLTETHTMRPEWLVLLLLTGLLSGCLWEAPPEEVDVIETHEGPHATTTPLVNNTDAVPVTANIRILNIDGDATSEVVFAEPMEGRIAWIDSECIPDCENLTTIENLGSPVRVAAADLDGNGINEIIVSDIGQLFPSNDLVGRILKINATGDVSVLADGLGRTVCAEPADLDADGDLDLTLCEFGHDEGSVGWLEQGDTGWTHHVLDPRPGAIHAIPADIDGDGDLDIVAAVSQTVEQLMLYRNDGDGSFTNEILFDAQTEHHGTSGIDLVDVDGDGDLDIVATNGDAMDWNLPDDIHPSDIHGLSILTNDGNGSFTRDEIVGVWGAYASTMHDVNQDGNLDIVLVCIQIPQQFPEIERTPLLILERNGTNWDRIDVDMDEIDHMITIVSTGEHLLVGSHAPSSPEGGVNRLAMLTIITPE
ncbi:MAG: hypothetical protein DBX05_00120 [Candidatus Poseidoniales archaeon]|nr:MAG: hypothetical protein CMA23_005435 [Euryarchaeota archaeon]RCH74523.1 MAG: hypothetical protein DBX05_00120 [Candidatus Poseidoniales archaeon]|tara:strand:- start:4234 stop:5532 length:1299 start_codon:yes stop_codon:yes gene_type:complete